MAQRVGRVSDANVAAFRVVLADPPWRFGDKLPGAGRGAEKHYRCLSVAELCAFPLPSLADDATLFLWRVASMQQEALDVMAAWGFTLKTEIIWLKRTPTASGGSGWAGRCARNTKCVSSVPRAVQSHARSRFARSLRRPRVGIPRNRRCSMTSSNRSGTAPTWNCSHGSDGSDGRASVIRSIATKAESPAMSAMPIPCDVSHHRDWPAGSTARDECEEG